MFSVKKEFTQILLFLIFLGAVGLPLAARNNEVLGEVRFQAENGPAKSAGVWVDGKYIGYLNELKGSKKLLLLPGEHEISVRQAGYHSVDQKIEVRPNFANCAAASPYAFTANAVSYQR